MRQGHVLSLLLVGAVLVPCACDNKGGNNGTPRTEPPKSERAAPDNTAKNQRDRDGATPTPEDQGETEADRAITAEIRKAVVAEKGLSVNAQNCKIITRGGVVTLRGPVDSAAEKDRIAAIAKATAGVTSVVDELEVKTK